jgi:hypothetical protein
LVGVVLGADADADADAEVEVKVLATNYGIERWRITSPPTSYEADKRVPIYAVYWRVRKSI